MAYREVIRVEIEEVVRRWQAGEGLRRIATNTGISRTSLPVDQAGQAGVHSDPGVAGPVGSLISFLALYRWLSQRNWQ